MKVPRPLSALLFALLIVLAFPFRVGELRFDVGAVVGWFVLVPLIWLVHELPPRRAFGWAAGAATLGYAGVLFWIFVVVNHFGQAPAPIAVLSVLLLAGYVGLHVGFAAALHAWLAPVSGALGFLVLPAAWVVSENLRIFDLFGGFPWGYLGYAVHADGPILELAAIGGIWGLSLLLASFAALLAEGRHAAAVVLLCAAHVVGLGLRVVNLPDPEQVTPPLRAAIVQGNIGQQMKWDPGLAESHFQAHLDTSRLAVAARDGIELIVWPESAAPIFLERQPKFAAALRELSRETGASVVVGAVGLEWPDEQGDPRIFNSVFAVTPEGGIVDRYDKTRLVPFGEYVPLRRVLGFVSAIATGLAGTADVTPGPAPRRLRGLNLSGNHAPAALICYEVIYPGLVREAVRDGARVLLNLTNDAWYGRTSAPHQFMAIARTRSAEHGLPMLRAANTGVSGVVDAGGVALKETPIFERRALPVDVPPARPGPTLYTRFGDWVVGASWLFLIGIGGMRLVRRRDDTDQRNPG